MARAVWNGVVIAESDDVVVVDGYTYFPRDNARWDHLEASAHRSRCFWKGTASYFDVVVGGKVNPDAACWYPEPSPAASMVKDRVAFWRGVKIEDGPPTGPVSRVIRTLRGD